MGFATTSSGLVGQTTKRCYGLVHAIEVVPTWFLDGKPMGWQRVVHSGVATEITTEYHGLSSADCDTLITASPAYITMTSTNPPHESSSRQWDKRRDGDSCLFTLIKTERTITG